MENFTHIHVHSVYSKNDATQTPKEIIEQVIKHGHNACALTDHGVISGLYEFQKLALEANIKPLLGSEVYLVKDLVTTNKNKRIRLKNNHCVLLAKNEDGWNNLKKLNNLSMLDKKHYFFKPRISFKELFENKKGLIVSSGCISSCFSNMLMYGKQEEAENLFDKFCYEFGEDFFSEIQLNELKEQKSYNNWLINQSNKLGIPIIITGDCHYATKDISKNNKRSVCKNLYYQGIEDFKYFNKIWNYGYSDKDIENWCNNTNIVSNKINYLNV